MKTATHKRDESQAKDAPAVPPDALPGLLALARFGLAMLREHRSSFGVGDIDGGTAQEQAVAAGLIAARTLQEPCGQHCHCASVDSFPLECFVTTQTAQAAGAWLDHGGGEAPHTTQPTPQRAEPAGASSPAATASAHRPAAPTPAPGSRAHCVGESFRRGEVWASPRGTLWRVMHELLVPGKKLQVVLRLGDVMCTGGRMVKRDWDAVEGWVIHRHADGRLAGETH